MLTKQDIEDAVSAGIKKELGQFFIEREKHYQHHEFIEGVICYGDKIKSTAVKTVTTSSIVGIIALILLGFVVWIKKQL